MTLVKNFLLGMQIIQSLSSLSLSPSLLELLKLSRSNNILFPNPRNKGNRRIFIITKTSNSTKANQIDNHAYEIIFRNSDITQL